MARLKIWNATLGSWQYVDASSSTVSASYANTSSVSRLAETSSILQAPSGSGTWKVVVNITSGSLDFIYS